MRLCLVALSVGVLLLTGCPQEGPSSAVTPPPGTAPPPVAVVSADEPAPVEPAPVEPAPVEPAPAEPAPAEPAPAEPAPAEPAPAEPEPTDTGLLDAIGGGGIGIDEIDPSVGTARVKDSAQVPRKDREPVTPEPVAPTPGTKPAKPAPKRPTRRPRRVAGGGAVYALTGGDARDFRPRLREGLFTVIEFYTDTWSTCRELGPQVAALVRKSSDTQLLRINIGKFNSRVALQYGIRSTPTLVLYQSTKRLSGDRGAILSFLQKRAGK